MPKAILTEVFVSNFTGVSKQGNLWLARYKGKYIGLFTSQLAAAEAYDDAVRNDLKNSQKIVYVNFPKGNEKKKKKRRGIVKNANNHLMHEGANTIQISLLFNL